MNVLKKLMKSIRQYKATSILSPVCVTLEVAMECIIPLYMVEMLEKIQIDNSIKNILFFQVKKAVGKLLQRINTITHIYSLS